MVMCRQADMRIALERALLAEALADGASTGMSLSAHSMRFLPSEARERSLTS